MITNYFKFCKIKNEHKTSADHAMCEVANETGISDNLNVKNVNKKISEVREKINYSNEIFRQKYEIELKAQKYMISNYKKELVDLIHKKFEEKTGCVVESNNLFKLSNVLFESPTKAVNIKYKHDVSYSRNNDINKVCYDKFYKSFLNYLEIFGKGADIDETRVECLKESVLESINEMFNKAIEVILYENNKKIAVD